MLTIEEARAIVKSGQARPALQRFIMRALQQARIFDLPGRETDPAAEDALVAALALAEIMDTADARAAMGLKRLPRGTSYDARYLHSQAVILAVRGYRQGRLAKDEVLTVLDHACETVFGKRPKSSVLQRLLGELQDYVAALESGFVDAIQAVHRVAGLPLDEGTLAARLDDMYRDAFAR